MFWVWLVDPLPKPLSNPLLNPLLKLPEKASPNPLSKDEPNCPPFPENDVSNPDVRGTILSDTVTGWLTVWVVVVVLVVVVDVVEPSDVVSVLLVVKLFEALLESDPTPPKLSDWNPVEVKPLESNPLEVKPFEPKSLTGVVAGWGVLLLAGVV